MISELPVPLNSSKITSSIRLPVSISAVAMMVSEPPSSMFRAAPKKRLGFDSNNYFVDVFLFFSFQFQIII